MPSATGLSPRQVERQQRFRELETKFTTDANALREKYGDLTSYQKRGVKNEHGVDVVGGLDMLVVPTIEGDDIPTTDEVTSLEGLVKDVQTISEQIAYFR